ATLVLAFPVAEGSAKARSGPPSDGPDCAGRGIWGGVLPLALRAGPLQADALEPAPPLPPGLRERARGMGLGPRVPYERMLGELLLSSDLARVDFPLVQRFLAQDSYWAKGVSAEALETSCRESLCFGLYRGSQQLAFARVLTDFARIAYLGDVFVVAQERGKGLGKLLIQELMAHPDLAGVERLLLGTRDAQGLYTRYGFVEAPAGRYMVMDRRPR
ncbi:MAG TPA: GNAT family N-acetyltransferase, partial [Polyangiales bacterium]